MRQFYRQVFLENILFPYYINVSFYIILDREARELGTNFFIILWEKVILYGIKRQPLARPPCAFNEPNPLARRGRNYNKSRANDQIYHLHFYPFILHAVDFSTARSSALSVMPYYANPTDYFDFRHLNLTHTHAHRTCSQHETVAITFRDR